jgi:hydroxymethylpyrimidine/phosphomethylpyrimidine kinase
MNSEENPVAPVLVIPDKPAKTPPVVLVFAASDPSSGAGIQADILTLASLGCHPLTVITALTVQDTLGVESIHPVEAELVESQARIILEDIPVAAFKIGVLGSVENVVAIAEIVSDYPDIPLILDPVLASGRGDRFGTDALINAIRELLLPQTTVVTPNTLEAERLCQFDDDDDGEYLEEQEGEPEELLVPREADEPLPGERKPDELEDQESDGEHIVIHPRLSNELNAIRPDDEYELLAGPLIAMGAQHVLITGTHAQTQDVCNRLYGEDGLIQALNWPRLPGSYHGSGCTLASAVAAGIACGSSVEEACRDAQEYTWQTLANGYRPGMGQFVPDRLFWAREPQIATDASDEASAA